ncbi:ribose-5-phosphate isomerase [Candidatus Kaiserbacteria bacterium CG10_big_fil_rev_8_21_14_0_10_51_14]|uniref:Ribose-5-phosphate isomerase n=1 Tax=Candidatus Kaiserbacteria bacterium CG10_big_fil_rev_8_21_14_0_10_51_14 TaxID=1974610 RepID=A0A2H0UBP4_9BACT|nr:MAG: ribose-5-phosphate isomerase [Candidatus Kaiserbacteria bacterium CG10_big_fil_rev_8_21_14_0_10_51_14]
MKIYFASDHGGFEIKNQLLAFVRDELGHDVEDCGAFEYVETDDYPEIIANAARKLARDALEGNDSRAIVAGGSGQGEAIVANRFKGVRCAVYYGKALREQKDMSGKKLDMLASSREHNNANALSLGLRFLSLEEAKEAAAAWLALPHSGEERHARRIKQIDEVN